MIRHKQSKLFSYCFFILFQQLLEYGHLKSANSHDPNGTVSLYFFAHRKLECFHDLRPLHGNNYRHQPVHSVLVFRLKQNGFLISDADC